MLDEEGRRDASTGKFRCLLDVGSFLVGDNTYIEHISTTSASLLCLVLNKNFVVMLRASTREFTIVFSVVSSFQLVDMSPVVDALFLCDQQKTYLTLGEGANVRMYSCEQDDSVQPCTTLTLNTTKRFRGAFVTKLSKLTCSKCLVCDNVGHLSLLHIPNELTPLKFPSSVGGHGVNCVIGFKHTAEGILAVCNSEHTINLYKLADVLCSVSGGTSTYVKPYRVLCSQFPITSITFVKSDQLVMASAINQSITFWGGFSSTVTGG